MKFLRFLLSLICDPAPEKHEDHSSARAKTMPCDGARRCPQANDVTCDECQKTIEGIA